MSMARGFLSEGKPRVYLVHDQHLYFFYSVANRDAFLLASSPGSWADRLSLYASLQASLVPAPKRETHGVRLAAARCTNR